jgi:hypothetical protein
MIVERFVHNCKGTVLARERTKVNRRRFFPNRERLVNTNDRVPRERLFVFNQVKSIRLPKRSAKSHVIKQ